LTASDNLYEAAARRSVGELLAQLADETSTYFRQINAIWLLIATGVLRQLDSASQMPAPVAAVQER
jgi:hypothetical protein